MIVRAGIHAANEGEVHIRIIIQFTGIVNRSTPLKDHEYCNGCEDFHTEALIDELETALLFSESHSARCCTLIAVSGFGRKPIYC